jgi:hypothetical protein
MTTQQMEAIKEQITEVTRNQAQAFPCVIRMSDTSYFLGGMSLRDWLAGQALAGLATHGAALKIVAAQAVELADLVLAELEDGEVKHSTRYSPPPPPPPPMKDGTILIREGERP